jgi:hypothetical protein
MNLDAMSDQLMPYLKRADLDLVSDDFPDLGYPARRWQSPYGILFCVDASASGMSGLTSLTQACDDYLAQRLENFARGGVELDAHLCMFVDSKLFNELGSSTMSEIEWSRFVSRKYFLDASRAPQEIIGRLTLLWPKINEAIDRELTDPTPAAITDLRRRIDETSGAESAKRFLEGYG